MNTNFQKKVSISSSKLLGSKDLKKLKADILKNYQHLEQDSLALLIPPQVAQLRLNTRVLVYSQADGDPLFFDPTGHNDELIPTVYALVIVPDLVQPLFTTPDVSPRIMGGADLFYQGLLHYDNMDWLAGSIRALYIPDNPVPFAVGKMLTSRAVAARDGFQGRGMQVFHVYTDLLWQLGKKVPPNRGFLKNKVVSIESERVSTESGVGVEGQMCEAELLTEPPVSVLENEVDPIEASEKDTSEVDKVLEYAAIGGLHSVKATDLPITTSDFYTKHMQPLRPHGVAFELKKSKYKKLCKLLDYLEEEKLITQKTIRKQEHITAVDRKHKTYLGWKPVTQTKPDGDGKNGALRIEFVYKIPCSLRKVFPEDDFYTKSQVDEHIAAYVGTGTHPELDEVLSSALKHSIHGDKEAVGGPLERAVLLEKVIDALSLHHKIIKGNKEEVVRKGLPKPVTIATEKRSGHVVTSVSRVEGLGFEAHALGGELQRVFKASSSVSKLPGKFSSDYEIVIQGDCSQSVALWFQNEHGIPSSLVSLKTPNKKLPGKRPNNNYVPPK